MASMDSAPAKASSVLEDQQSLLNSELMNEVFAIKCSNASRPSSGVQTGLRHRLPNNAGESGRVTDDAQKKCLLGDQVDTTSKGDRVDTTSKGDLKPHDGSFAKCMERFMSACRSHMNIVLRRKHRRPAKSTKLVTPSKRTQAALEGEDNCNIAYLGRGCWRCLKTLGNMVKIEEEIVSTKKPRSTLYYA